ncbi:hypothetical protein DL766_004263 [Monosporascus sp. MC13-8B]|nr:hypothetical protein DL766_004263 [Monosporascus sp. MC13-8B]
MSERANTKKMRDASPTPPGADLYHYHLQQSAREQQQQQQQQGGGSDGGNPDPDEPDNVGSQMYHEYLQREGRLEEQRRRECQGGGGANTFYQQPNVPIVSRPNRPATSTTSIRTGAHSSGSSDSGNPYPDDPVVTHMYHDHLRAERMREDSRRREQQGGSHRPSSSPIKMPLELYHMHLSQSERIVWLLEEMEIPYELKVFYRDPVTALSPDELKALNPAGTAPYLRDTNVSPPVCLSESTAIAAYLLAVYGPQSESETRLDRAPGDPDYAAYLEWFHYANGTLQASLLRQMSLMQATGDPEHAGVRRGLARLEAQLRLVDERLARTGAWLAGERLSAVDCMAVFSLTTMRGFYPLDLAPYPNILRWLRDVADRPAHRRALDKGDDSMEPMIGPTVRKFTEFPGLKAVLEKF